MTLEELHHQIKEKNSFLCVGLDTDLDKIPAHLKSLEDPIFAFNKEIIDQTKDLCVSYKLNLAFYERYGTAGWKALERTVNYIPNEHFKIADAKRGDIGNTADMYAKAFFEELNFDAVTLSPYMGRDSIEPFLKYQGKWAIILGLTSNQGSADFQLKELRNGSSFYEEVISLSAQWGNNGNTMFVVGATREEHFAQIRKLIPDHFLLVPGVGAQGGSLEDVCRFGMNSRVGLLINSSRAIIYAGNGPDFGEKARKAAIEVRDQMEDLLT